MHALGVAGDLGADHAVGVVEVARAPDPTDPVPRQAFDLEHTGAGTVVRAGGFQNFRHG